MFTNIFGCYFLRGGREGHTKIAHQHHRYRPVRRIRSRDGGTRRGHHLRLTDSARLPVSPSRSRATYQAVAPSPSRLHHRKTLGDFVRGNEALRASAK